MGCNCGKRRVFYIASNQSCQDMVEYIINTLGKGVNPLRVVQVRDLARLTQRDKLYIQESEYSKLPGNKYLNAILVKDSELD